MTKFEEELFYKVPCKFEITTEAEYKKSTLINHFKNWHSDEEFQRLLEQNAELTQENNIVNQIDSQLTKENEDLKSQLQQQALPVVPECVAKTVELLKKNPESSWSKLYNSLGEEGVDWLNEFQHKDERFGFGELNNKLFVLFHLAINGYTVEKPKLFYLREKNTNYYLNKSKNNGLELVPNPYFDEDNQFTQQEIDSMETGSYEKIEVEK